jgi:HTH-type transcriptional regulator / antitoxin HipB
MKIVVNTPGQLGALLSSARKAKRMTQAEAAAHLGVGQPRLSLLETSQTGTLSFDQFLALTALYELEVCVQKKGGPRESYELREPVPEW